MDHRCEVMIALICFIRNMFSCQNGQWLIGMDLLMTLQWAECRQCQKIDIHTKAFYEIACVFSLLPPMADSSALQTGEQKHS